MTDPTPAATAQAILDQAAALGWTVSVQGAVLTITKRFNAGCIASYAQAGKEYPRILALAFGTRAEFGGVWGSTGAGAARATRLGLFVMNRGGVSGPVLEAIAARATPNPHPEDAMTPATTAQAPINLYRFRKNATTSHTVRFPEARSIERIVYLVSWLDSDDQVEHLAARWDKTKAEQYAARLRDNHAMDAYVSDVTLGFARGCLDVR